MTHEFDGSKALSREDGQLGEANSNAKLAAILLNGVIAFAVHLIQDELLPN